MFRTTRARMSFAGVLFVLGFLAVVQLRSQGGGSALDQLSAQDLTQLVANLNARNDQLRVEVAELDRQLVQLTSSQSRGDSAAGQIRLDLVRIRVWAGLDAAYGPGIMITVRGPVSGTAIEDLLNELRNAGAEAIEVADVRIVGGVVVAGEAGALVVENTPLTDPFVIRAIGSPEALTGSVTRAGGIIAQLAATFPDALFTVTPVERMDVDPTSRTIVPEHGKPRL